MKEDDSDLWRLRHIAEALKKIEVFSSACHSFEEFFEEEKTQASVKYELMVIGEATNKLSPRLKAHTDKVQWRAIVGMRNYLAHEYFAVDLNTIWQTIQKDLPIFRSVIEDLIIKLKETK